MNNATDDKIGGWLILYAVGMVIYPLQTAYVLTTQLLPAVFSDNWAALTSPSNPGYGTLWAPLVIAELAGNSVFLIVSVVIAVLFFRRHHWVPRLVILFMAVNILFVGADYFIINYFLVRGDLINLDATVNFVRTAVAGAIWIPYFMFSRRVAQTFTR